MLVNQPFEGVDEKEWMNLMSSDECMVEINGKGQVHVTCCPGEEFDENCVIAKMKQSNIKAII